MTWHADAKMLELYARGVLDNPHAYSVELHLIACEACRDAIASVADEGRLDRVWSGIEAAVMTPARGPIERMLIAAGVSDHVARLLAATPSLRTSWFLAVAIALAFGVIAAHVAAGGLLLFLVVAPLLPLAGVAAAYGPGVDPTYEIGLVAPLRSFRLLLIRAIAVLISTTTLALIASLALPSVGWMAAAWLLPSLALVTTSLALSSLVAPLLAASSVAVVWIAAMSLGAAAGTTSLFGPQFQVTVLAVSLLSVGLLGARREAFEGGDHAWRD